MITATQPSPAGQSLSIERIFNAPRARIFKAWTNTEDLLKWYGPAHHPMVKGHMMARPGELWNSTLRSVETGRELPQIGTYLQVVEPELLVFTFLWQDHHEENVETLVTVRFEDLGKKTRMIFHQEPFTTASNRDGHSEGWNSSFDRLAAYLA